MWEQDACGRCGPKRAGTCRRMQEGTFSPMRSLGFLRTFPSTAGPGRTGRAGKNYSDADGAGGLDECNTMPMSRAYFSMKSFSKSSSFFCGETYSERPPTSSPRNVRGMISTEQKLCFFARWGEEYLGSLIMSITFMGTPCS